MRINSENLFLKEMETCVSELRPEGDTKEKETKQKCKDPY
jgi:hypothetical protein